MMSCIVSNDVILSQQNNFPRESESNSIKKIKPFQVSKTLKMMTFCARPNPCLLTNELFNPEYRDMNCPIFWGNSSDQETVKQILCLTIHNTLMETWPKLRCLCKRVPELRLNKTSKNRNRVFLTCSVADKSGDYCCKYFQWIDAPLDQKMNREAFITNNQYALLSLGEPLPKKELVAPPNATNPFAESARRQQRERMLMKPAMFNPWGVPQPTSQPPYLAITEDGYAITQDGRYEPYKLTKKFPTASPRFKQLYLYHKNQGFYKTTPVTEEFLEGKYGQFLQPLENPRRERLQAYHNSTLKGFEKLFSLEELERTLGHKVKKPTKQKTHRFEQLFNFYKKQRWQVDMPVTEEWLEKSYGMLFPKEEFALTERYWDLASMHKDMNVFEEWLERIYGSLVPKSLEGRRVHHLIECFQKNKSLKLTDTALEYTYGPLVSEEKKKVFKPFSMEFGF